MKPTTDNPKSMTISPAGEVLEGGAIKPLSDPIGYALETADNGATVLMEEGTYPTPQITRHMRPAAMVAHKGCVIAAGSQDTFGFSWPDTHRDIAFHGWTIMCGWRSGIMYLMNAHAHKGINDDFHGHSFIDCWIDGGWNHATNSGTPSKWGLLGNRCSGFVWSGGGVRNIQQEHCFYFHNNGPGGAFIQNAELGPCGRTFAQHAGRNSENNGQPGLGPFVIRNVKARLGGLADGASGFTFSGHTGQIELNGIVHHMGTDERLAEREIGGSVVLWSEWAGTSEKPGAPNGQVIIANCEFSATPQAGGRALIIASACESLTLAKNTLRSGRFPVALDLEPGKFGHHPDFPIHHYLSWRSNKFYGDIRYRGLTLPVLG